MESVPGAGASGSGEGPSSSSSPAAPTGDLPQLPPASSSQPPSRYESQKRRDWNTFLQYLKNHKPPLTLARCSGAHVIEFLKYLDQFGKTKVHAPGCAFFGHPNPPSPCACPLRQAWGSLDALIGRLRAAYEESGGRPESNPFGARAVRIYLREIRESQAKARGIPYEKKKRKRSSGAGGSASMSAAAGASSSSSGPSATGVSTAPAIIIPSSVAGPSGSTAPPVRMPLTSSGSAAQRGPVGASTPHGGSTSGTT